MDHGSVLSVTDSEIMRTADDPTAIKSPREAGEASFLAMHPKRCGAPLGDDIHVKITDIMGLSGVVAYNGQEERSYVYTDDPETLEICEVTVLDNSCYDPELTCNPVTANSTEDAPDDP